MRVGYWKLLVWIAVRFGGFQTFCACVGSHWYRSTVFADWGVADQDEDNSTGVRESHFTVRGGENLVRLSDKPLQGHWGVIQGWRIPYPQSYVLEKIRTPQIYFWVCGESCSKFTTRSAESWSTALRAQNTFRRAGSTNRGYQIFSADSGSYFTALTLQKLNANVPDIVWKLLRIR